MAAAEKLSIGDKAGAQAKGKHTDWFTDGKGYGEEKKAPEQAQPQSRYIKITPNMPLAALKAATMNNMQALGEDSYRSFIVRMDQMMPNHRMLRSIKANILSDAPHFGSSRIGKVTLKTDAQTGVVTELQFYIANFDTIIDTSNPAKIHTPKSNKFGRTFFGAVIDIDAANPDPDLRGKAIGFNKSYGKEGVVFQTTEFNDALMFMTAFSSGKKPSEIAEMMERATNQVTAAAPGMRR